jgi:hypothetical protein
MFFGVEAFLRQLFGTDGADGEPGARDRPRDEDRGDQERRQQLPLVPPGELAEAVALQR